MNILKKIWLFYYEGFKNMPKWGRLMWTIILIKGFIVFVIVRSLFFPDFLKTNFKTDKERSEHVINELIKTSKNDTVISKH
jgi:predicted lactoylglutathione lyase